MIKLIILFLLNLLTFHVGITKEVRYGSNNRGKLCQKKMFKRKFKKKCIRPTNGLKYIYICIPCIAPQKIPTKPCAEGNKIHVS